ncbi:hypothetical protein BDP81DRAFT_439490 [Colletotrichum phormii]|uniref:Uncharacterized protein n=1 Tax=Colletotrichum phormii TaxID=359342 RepID=A0AAI9ZF50_9PEZI|nr:uncharacterized protein BDP81DRAFT_439490 [Colletotrichum phormii]KAK1623404.1 hypothetical protein BDP81DRAFT_439490 [Colletotrichum phormii]
MLANPDSTGHNEKLQTRHLAMPVAPKPLPPFRDPVLSLAATSVIPTTALSSLTQDLDLNLTDPRASKDHHRKGGRVGYGARLRSA